MNRFIQTVGFCLRLWPRAKGLRRDESGQVLVLTAVMAFLTVIMAIYTTNASILLFDRVIAQNSADAAADTFAAYQARGLNLIQHLNDTHYVVNMAAFAAEAVNWVGRSIGCTAAWACSPPIPNYGCYSACCRGLAFTGGLIDKAQSGIATGILAIQDFVNVAFPIMGTLSANDLARANGANELLPVLAQFLGQIADMFDGSTSSSVGDAFDKIADKLPRVPIYTFPFKPGQIIDLGTEKKGADYLFWSTKIGGVDILQTAATVSDVVCGLSGSVATDSNLGWDDEYFCGGPAANTWMVGKDRRAILPKLIEMPWLNPKMDEPEQVAGLHAYEDDYARFRSRNFGSTPDKFENPAFFALASSQVEGQVVVDRTIFNSKWNGDSDYGKPKLITVQPPGGIDGKYLLLWH